MAITQLIDGLAVSRAAIEKAFIEQLCVRCNNIFLPREGEADEWALTLTPDVTVVPLGEWYLATSLELHGFKFWMQVDEYYGSQHKISLKWRCVKGLGSGMSRRPTSGAA